MYDLTWQIYWQYVEACIGCIMASVSTFWTFFVTSNSDAARKKTQGLSYAFCQRLENKLRRSGAKDPWEGICGDDEELSAIPLATRLGMRTCICRNNPSTVQTTGLLTCTYEDDDDKHTIYVLTYETRIIFAATIARFHYSCQILGFPALPIKIRTFFFLNGIIPIFANYSSQDRDLIHFYVRLNWIESSVLKGCLPAQRGSKPGTWSQGAGVQLDQEVAPAATYMEPQW